MPLDPPSLERRSIFSARPYTLEISRYAIALFEMILKKSKNIERCNNQLSSYTKH